MAAAFIPDGAASATYDVGTAAPTPEATFHITQPTRNHAHDEARRKRRRERPARMVAGTMTNLRP